MIYNLSSQYDIERCKTYLESLIKKQVRVELCQRKDKRTLDQNSLMWLWLSCISRETGNDKDNLHEFFKQKFLGTKNCLVFGVHNVSTSYSTKKLDTKQMTDYLNKIQVFASSELGILLPEPQDLHWNEFLNQYDKFI